MQYAIDCYGKNPIFLINKHIGYDEEDGQGICGIEFSKEVFEVDSYKPDLITIMINSSGGGVKEGFDILTSMLECKSETKTILAGFGYSTSGWLLFGGKKRCAYDHSIWMCHLPYNPENPSEETPFLKMVTWSICKIISEASGLNGVNPLSVEDIYDMMKKKTYLNAQQLKELGLIHEVIPSGGNFSSEDKTSYGKEEIKNQHKEFNKILNKYIPENTKNQDVMSDTNKEIELIANHLKLENGAGARTINDEISRMRTEMNVLNKEKDALKEQLQTVQNRVKELETSETTLKSDVQNKESEINKLKSESETDKTEIETLKNKVTEFESKTKDAEKAALEVKVQNKVKELVNTGRIKDEDENIASVTNQFMNDFDGMSLIFDNLPVNMHVPRPDIKEEENKSIHEPEKGSFEWFQARNKERISKAK